MNKKLYTLCAIAAAFVLAGCQKENNEEATTYVGPTHTVTFTAEKMIDTKTAIDTEGNGVVSYKWLSDDDERMEILEFYTVEEDGTTKTKSRKGTINGMSLSNNDKSATFTATFTGTAPETLLYYQAAYAGEFSSTNNPKIPATQNPLPNTFDPAADVLVSEQFDNGRTETSFVFNMTRKVSVNKMTLKGLEEGEIISSVTFESDKAHSATYVLTSGEYSTPGNKLTLNYTTNNTVPSSGEFPVYFTTAPVEDATFTVSVVTDQHKYRKTSSKTITFATGSVRRFGVNLSGCEVPDGRAFTLVEDVDDLVIGSDVVIAANGSKNIAMSTTQKDNNRGETEATKSADGKTIAVDDQVVQIFTLTNGTTSGTYAFLCKNGSQVGKYIYAAASNKNYLRSQETLDANASWTISISSKEASIIAQGSNTRNVLQYNTGDNIFSCYASASQQNVYLYQAAGLPAANLSFTDDSYTFTLGDSDYTSFTGQALNNPNHISDIIWSSSDTSVATVDSDGEITWVPDATGTTTITATFEGDDFFGAGNASYTITVNEPIVGPEVVTIAEFLEKEVSETKWYQITGTITNLASTVYGNFDLVDASGQVYVYGLTSTQQESNDKSFSSLNLQEGDTVTIITLRSEHNNTAQAGGTIPAYYESHIGVFVTPTSLNFDAVGGTKTATATASGFDGTVTITASSDNTQFTATISGTTVSITAAANQSSAEINGTVTVTATDGTTTKSKTISILQAKPVSQAEDGDILWQEDFTGYGTTMPSSATGTHVYEGGTVTYTLTNGGTTTKLYSEGSAGGTSPELLISKTNGAFTISSIPTGGASTMTLTFKSNHGDYCAISSSTSGITVGTTTISGSMVSVSITANSGVTSFDLAITNTNSSNTRVDDFVLVVGVPPVTLSSIAVSGQTLSFTVGDTFVFDGTVTATYSDGSTEDVTSLASVSNPNMSTQGQKTVTVSYTEDGVTKTTSYTITVGTGGGSETMTFSSLYSSNTVLDGTVINGSNFTVTFNKRSGGTATQYYTNGYAVRWYGGGTLLVSGKSGKKITGVVINFTQTANSISASTGTYSLANNVGTWSGNASSVTFTQSGTTGQCRISSIEVSYTN